MFVYVNNATKLENFFIIFASISLFIVFVGTLKMFSLGLTVYQNVGTSSFNVITGVERLQI